MKHFTLLSPDVLQSFRTQVPSGHTPLWEYWNVFQERYLESGRSAVTLISVRDALLLVLRKLDLFSIEDVNNQILLEEKLFLYKRTTNISNATYNTYLKNLNTYFLWLEKRGYISVNNIRKVMRCKESIIEQSILSEEQVSRIVGQIHTRRQNRLERLRNILFIDLLRFTAARPCELLSLRLQDFVKEGDTYKIQIRGQKQKGRVRYYRCASFLRDSFEAYKTYRSQFRDNEHMLFISSSKRTGWTGKGMRGLFKRLSKELGFKVTAYGFRRYVATKLYNQGVPLEQIKNYLGHTRITTTMRYIERSCFLTNAGAKIMGMDSSPSVE